MTKVSRKYQITIPVSVLREAGIVPGDELSVRVLGPGRLELERPSNLVDRWAGALPSDTFPTTYLSELRDEWQR